MSTYDLFPTMFYVRRCARYCFPWLLQQWNPWFSVFVLQKSRLEYSTSMFMTVRPNMLQIVLRTTTCVVCGFVDSRDKSCDVFSSPFCHNKLSCWCIFRLTINSIIHYLVYSTRSCLMVCVDLVPTMLRSLLICFSTRSSGRLFPKCGVRNSDFCHDEVSYCLSCVREVGYVT